MGGGNILYQIHTIDLVVAGLMVFGAVNKSRGILLVSMILRYVKRYAMIIEQFWGDDVLDSFIMEYRDEDSILDQMYENQICYDFYHNDFNYLKHLAKMNTYIKEH